MVNGFSDPWEHVRLFSDGDRNKIMVDVVTRHSAGKRVLEVGCGTGLLSCVAARSGATKVYAVETTRMWKVATELVYRNGLEDIVEVLHGDINGMEPKPVDLVFSELLHADPFLEGVVGASNAGSKWLVPGGRLIPSQLSIYAALVRADGAAWEQWSASEQLRHYGDRFNLDMGPVVQELTRGAPCGYNTAGERPLGPPKEVYRVTLGDGAPVPGPVDLTLSVDEDGPVGGVVIWFDATMDEETGMANPPGHSGHWGQLVQAFSAQLSLPAGGTLRVRFQPDDEGVLQAAPLP